MKRGTINPVLVIILFTFIILCIMVFIEYSSKKAYEESVLAVPRECIPFSQEKNALGVLDEERSRNLPSQFSCEELNIMTSRGVYPSEIHRHYVYAHAGACQVQEGDFHSSNTNLNPQRIKARFDDEYIRRCLT